MEFVDLLRNPEMREAFQSFLRGLVEDEEKA